MIVLLPWPHKDLSPNARIHWRKKGPLVALAKRDAFLLARMLPEGQRQQVAEAKALRLTVTLMAPDSRRRDQDNCIARLKAHLDGIFQACKADDSLVRETVIRWGEKLPGGCVRVELEAM